MNLINFIISSFAFDLYPGEVFFIVITVVLQYGVKAGIFAAFGVALCDLIACLSGVFGLTAVFEIFPVLKYIMKAAGAIYLGHIGISGILQYKNRSINLTAEGHMSSASYLSFTKKLFFLSILNPLVYFGDSGLVLQFAGNETAQIKLLYIFVFFLVSFTSFSLLSICFGFKLVQERLTQYHEKLKIISSIVISILALFMLKDLMVELYKTF